VVKHSCPTPQLQILDLGFSSIPNRHFQILSPVRIDYLVDGRYENFAITDLTCPGGDFVNHHINLIILNNYFNFEFLQKLNSVLRTAIAFGLTLLPPKPGLQKLSFRQYH